jgi:hypothetical protein
MTQAREPVRPADHGESAVSAREPRADRPRVRDYGIPASLDGLLPWSWAVDHLEHALTYWIATVRPDGRPHAVPTWAVWLDGALWFEGGVGTRRARNLATNSNAVASIHIDDDAALIVEGAVEMRADPPVELAARLVEAYAKYRPTRWAYEADPANWSTENGGGLWALRPTVVLGWTRFPDDATRWRFGS